MTTEPMTLGRLRALTAPIPDDAELHGYLHPTGVTVQAEWTAPSDGIHHAEIMNPVILRIPFEIWAGAAVAEPEWAAYETVEEVAPVQPVVDLMAALEASLARAKEAQP